MGITQKALAEAVGVTFQQVQKYETGQNRIAASTLVSVAEVLKVSVGYFCDDEPVINEALPGNAEVRQALDVKYARELVVAYGHVKDEQVRARLFELVRSMAYKRPAH